MKNIESEMSSDGRVGRPKLSMRAVCRVAGITEQTLHKMEHSSLKQEIRIWMSEHCQRTANDSVVVESRRAEKLKEVNGQLGGLAAELVALRKGIIDLEEENC